MDLIWGRLGLFWLVLSCFGSVCVLFWFLGSFVCYFGSFWVVFRGGSTAAATSKMEHFMIIFNG